MGQAWTQFLALGCLQGILMAVVLLTFNSANKAGNRVLAITVILLSLILAEEYFEASGLYKTFPKILFSTFPFDMAFGPLIYLYATSISFPQKFPKAMAHLLPVVVLFPAYLIFHFVTRRGAFVLTDPGVVPVFVMLVNLKIGYLAAYFFMALRKVSPGVSSAPGEPANNRNLKKAVFNILRVTFISVVLIYVLFNLNVFMPGRFPPSDLFSAILITGGIYLLVIVAIRFPFVFTRVNEPDFYIEKIRGEQTARYRSSPLSPGQKTTYVQQLLALMQEQKPYRNNQLKVEDLAAQLKIPVHHLSQVINEVLEKNFYELVNYYRVEDVKQKMFDPAEQNKSMLGMAMDAGFNSKATFNRVFKEFTGLSPSAYKLQARDKKN